MILVNHRVVVSQDQWNLLALQAEPMPSDNWMHNEAWIHLTSLPVLVAPMDGTPIDCGDGWLACYKFESLYAWNDAQIKASLERVVRESSFGSLTEQFSDRHDSIGLFQQAARDYYTYTQRTPREFLGGII